MNDNLDELSRINIFLEEQEDSITQSFSNLIQSTGEHGDLHAVGNKLMRDIRNGVTTGPDLYLQSLPQTKNHKKLFGVLVQLTAHDLLSLIKARDCQQTAEAIKHLMMAKYHLGRLQGAFDSGLYTLNEKNTPTEPSARRPKDRIETIKSKILSLLEYSAKSGKRAKSLEEAFNLINQDLGAFLISQHFTKPTVDGIPRAVNRWRKTDTAFNNNFIKITEKLMN